MLHNTSPIVYLEFMEKLTNSMKSQANQDSFFVIIFLGEIPLYGIFSFIWAMIFTSNSS